MADQVSPAPRAAPAPAPAAPTPKTPTQDELWQLAKTQSDERRALAKKQAEARQALRKPNGKHDPAAAPVDAKALADLRAAQADERAALRDSQAKARTDLGGTMPVFNGYDLQEKVTQLHADLSAVATEHRFEVGELTTWDTEFDIFDPVTGLVMSPARTHRRDIGHLGALMTVDAVISDIESARKHQATAGVTQYAADNVMT